MEEKLLQSLLITHTPSGRHVIIQMEQLGQRILLTPEQAGTLAEGLLHHTRQARQQQQRRQLAECN